MTDKTKGPKADKPAKADKVTGQDKLITLVNAATGATQQVTKSDFKVNRATYEAAGFARQDDETEAE